MIVNKEVEQVLRLNGWSENRKVDRELIISALEAEGYYILGNVIDFLENFWGLNIIFHNKRNGVINDNINFCFEDATHLEVAERVNRSYSSRIGKKLCLIGSAYRDHMVLIMAEDCSVYGGYDDYLCKIGNTGIEAIEAIIHDKIFTEID